MNFEALFIIIKILLFSYLDISKPKIKLRQIINKELSGL